LIFSIFSFLNLNILHKKIEDVFLKAFKTYILTDFSFLYKNFEKLKTRYFLNRVFQPWILQTFATAKLGRGFRGGGLSPLCIRHC